MSKAVKIIDEKKAKQALKKSPDILQQYVELLEIRYEMNKMKLQEVIKELKQCKEVMRTDCKG